MSKNLPDHTLVLRALIQGAARWDRGTGEICVGGLRYGTRPDKFGCPTLWDDLREALTAAITGEDKLRDGIAAAQREISRLTAELERAKAEGRAAGPSRQG